MEQNIETKDVQRTEYLDKNGLDMLWAKVKENTHNQVEVERNRAVAKENSITDKIDNLKYVPYTKLELSRYNIPGGISTGYITSKGKDNDSFDVYPNSELSFGTLYGGVSIYSESDKYASTKKISVDYDDMRIKFTDGTPNNTYAIYGENGVMLNVDNSSQSLLTADQSVKVIGTDITPLENGKVPAEYLDLSQYAKKTDITAVDTSDFVIKTARDIQTIKAPLTVTGNLFVNDINNETYAGLSVEQQSGQLYVFDKATSARTYLEGGSLQINEGLSDSIRITCQGIRNLDNNSNHVYATDGSIADLTKYIKIDDAYLGCIPYYNKYTESEIQRYQLADKEGIELSSYGTRTKLLGSDIAISSGSEDLKLTRSGISIDSYGGTSNHFYLDVNSTPRFSLYDNKCIISAKIYPNETAIIGISKHNYGGDTYELELSADGIEMLSKTTKDIVTANKSTAHIGLDDDQTEYTYVAPLENGKVPNKYLTAATKEDLGVVKVGDGLNVTDGTISVDKKYLIDILSYGVEWDTTVADPACIRIGNPLYHKQLPIQSEYKGCLVKNGVVNYYLDPNDWSKKADGTPSVLDGTDGDVMVHIPKFYGKSGSNGNKRWVRISTTKIDSSWVEIPEMFVSAYRITTYTDSGTTKVASVVNTTENYRGGSNRSNFDQYLSTDIFRTDLGKPRTNVSRSTMRTNANNSGQELLCYEYYKWVFYWAYVIEYANFNSQKEFNSELTSDGCHQGGLGSGITTWNYNNWNKYNNNSPITPCGYTNEFGNFSGVKQILIPKTQTSNSTTVNEKTLYANRWRGFENPFGDIWTNLDGIVLKRDSDYQESKVYTTSDSSKFGDDTSVMSVSGVEVAEDGFTKEFDLRETGEIIPQLVGGSESTYKCDYHWGNAQSTDKRTLVVGGDAYNGGVAGLSYFNSYVVDFATYDVGFRSVVLAA